MADVLELLVDDIVNSILYDIIDTTNTSNTTDQNNDITINVNDSNTNNNVNDNVCNSYIVEEADDVEETYIVEEADDSSSSNIINNDNINNTNTTTSTVIVNIDTCASLMNGCVVQPKDTSLYIQLGEGIISNNKIDDNGNALYLVTFDKAVCDSYRKASDLMLILNGIVNTECNFNKQG